MWRRWITIISSVLPSICVLVSLLVICGYYWELLIRGISQYPKLLVDEQTSISADSSSHKSRDLEEESGKYVSDQDHSELETDLEYKGVTLPQPYSALFHRADMRPLINESKEGSPFNYLPEYRNPCWMSRTKVGGRAKDKTNSTDAGQLRCFPLVHLAGFAKSGTTDIYKTLKLHPDLLGDRKEPLFWAMGRYGHYGMTFFTEDLMKYTRMWDKAAQDITDHRHRIIIDASSTKVYYMDGWKVFPGNEGLLEPKYTVAMTLHAVVAESRIIVIMREPVERTYSRYKFHCARATSTMQHESSPEMFHEYVTVFMREFEECLHHQTLRGCVYNYDYYTTWNISSTETHSSFIRASLYYVYVKDWLEVFPRDQIHFIFAEEYYENRSPVMRETFRFLDLDPDLLSPETYQQIEVSHVRAPHSNLKLSMLNKTRDMLREFFSPYNRMLADILHDERYTWEDHMT